MGVDGRASNDGPDGTDGQEPEGSVSSVVAVGFGLLIGFGIVGLQGGFESQPAAAAPTATPQGWPPHLSPQLPPGIDAQDVSVLMEQSEPDQD